MSLAAVICNHNYSRYLVQCLDSAWTFCDEILVYDDGSTDDSVQVIKEWATRKTEPLLSTGIVPADNLDGVYEWYEDGERYASCWSMARGRKRILLRTRPDATGDPIWGSNLGIEDATTTHLIFLDADNYLLSEPPQRNVDYTFAPIIAFEDGKTSGKVWKYDDWPLNAKDCWQHFLANDPPPMPFPAGGVFSVAFLKGKRWRSWATTKFAQDMRFFLDICKFLPTLAYHKKAVLAFRIHKGQWSQHPDREVMYAEARLAKGEPFDLIG